MKDESHTAVSRLSERIAAATGLSLSSSEDLQVVNYGVGGYYSPHFDFSRDADGGAASWEGSTGQRLATWLIYLSRVPRGGATVFKRLGFEVKPDPGMALFWYNVPRTVAVGHVASETNLSAGCSCKPSKTLGDERTEHGACPVLVGSKWIATKWFHEAGQERVRHDWPD